MDDTRAKITCRIDRVACCPTEGKTDDPYQKSYRDSAYRTQADWRCIFCSQGSICEMQDGEYQDKSTDCLTDDVDRKVPDSWSSTKYRLFCAGIFCLRKMILIDNPHGKCTEHGAEELSQHIRCCGSDIQIAQSKIGYRNCPV